MPRIRTIKPEFWDSPSTARASLRGRLFFIAMWNWADDYGVGTANPRQLMSFAFPNDPDVGEADFEWLRTEVATCFDVQWYETEGRPYYAIPSWDEHQKNERRAARRNPSPDQALFDIAEMDGVSVLSNGISALGKGTGEREQGNRGTGERRATRLPAGWNPSPKLREQIAESWPSVDIITELDSFRDYWHAKAGKDATKLDWEATFRNWCRRQHGWNVANGWQPPVAVEDEWRQRG